MDDIRNIPVREKAFIILRDAIIKGLLKPGERLIEDNLAEQFQVSRTPLREAIHKLELEGFVARLPKRGVMVAEISAEQAKELYDVRAYLDGLAARLTAERLTDYEIVALNVMREGIHKAIIAKDFDHLRENDVQFHEFIKNACKHAVCTDHLNKLYPHLSRYRNIAILFPGRRELSSKEHLHIIDLILAGRGHEAELAMREHINNASQSVSNAFKKLV